MRKIIITSCSQRKKTNENLLPAIERYNGPSFYLLRKYIKQSPNDLDIYILSAKFGLLAYKTKIPFYEQKLTKEQSADLSVIALAQINQIFTKSKKQKEIFINLGSLYLEAFEPALSRISKHNLITYAKGSSGKRLAEMYDWLYGKNSSLHNEQINEVVEKEAVIQGVRFTVTEAEIHQIVQKEISQKGKKDLEKFQSWFVPVDDLKVSPKWLISQLTDLPVSKFHSDQARKVLQKRFFCRFERRTRRNAKKTK